MKAMAIEEFSTEQDLHLSNLPTPQPQDNEVQIAVAYAAVNPVDWKICHGMLKERLPHSFPLIPGWDVSGTIGAVGKNVKNLKVGDEVFAYCRKPTVQWGTFAEYVCFDAVHVAPKPKNLTLAQAAAIPLTALTAWQALFDLGNLQNGETVLIHAGAGGVGGMSIQLAKNAGARVITTARQNHHSYVKKLGADIVIDYTQVDFVNKVREVVPDGVDLALDTIGGETLEKSFRAVRSGGRLLSIVAQVSPELAAQYRIQPGYVFVRPNGEQLKQIANLIESGKIQPPVIEEMGLTHAVDALAKVREGHTAGKIVLNAKS